MNQNLQQHEETVEKASWLRRRFGRKHVSENAEAVAEASSETVSDEVKIAELKQAIQQREKHYRTGKIALLVAVLTFPTAIFGSILPLFGGRSMFELSPPFLLPAFVFCIAGVFLGSYCYGLANMVRGMVGLRQAAAALTDTEDMRAAGPLIDVLKPGVFAQITSATAAVALNRLLPRLRASDAGLLDDKQRAALYHALRSAANPKALARYNPEFAVTVLRTLEQIGDDKAIPIVERLALGRAKTPSQMRIQQAAQECLSFLRARLESVDDIQPSLLEAREETELPISAPMQAESVDTLTEQFIQTARVNRRNFRIAAVGGGVGFCLTMLSEFAMFFVPRHASLFGSPFVSWDMGGLLFGACILTVSGFFISYNASRTRGLTHALSNTEDLRVVGPLAEALNTQDAYGMFIVMDALTRLLPRLRASDAGLLNDNQRAGLYRMLNRLGKYGQIKTDKVSADFVVAALKALEQVGDANALPAVERLANMKAKKPLQKRVQEAAHECLPFLLTKAEQQRAEETLLRASGEAQTPPEVLLRPATGSTILNTEVLLRPGGLSKEINEDR